MAHSVSGHFVNAATRGSSAAALLLDPTTTAGPNKSVVGQAGVMEGEVVGVSGV